MGKVNGEMFKDAGDVLRYRHCGSVVPISFMGQPTPYSEFVETRKAERRASRMAGRSLAQIRALRPKTFPRYDMSRGGRG